MAAQNGTGFTNLSNILNANQGNQLGSTVQKGLAGNVAGLQNNVNQATQQFNTQVGAANENTAANQNTVSQAIQNIVNAPANSNAPQGQLPGATPSGAVQPLANPTPLVMAGGGANKTAATPNPTPTVITPAAATSTAAASTPAATTPTATAAPTAAAGSFGVSTVGSGTNQTSTANAPSAGTLANFAQLLQGQYTGPQSLSNYAQLLANSQNLQSQGQNANTAGGQQALLQQYAGGGKNYTQGEQGLDQLLLGQSQPQLQSIINQTRNLSNVPTQANNQATQLAQATAAGNQNFAQGIQNQITGAENPILGNIQSQINTLNAQNAPINTAANKISSLLNNGLVSSNVQTGGMMPARSGVGPAVQTSTPTSQAQEAINIANQNGILQPGQYAQLGSLITQMANSGQNPMAALSAAFDNNQASPYTLQQGATATQAAQLNALQQLGGQTQQYGTYGGATPSSASFDMSKLPTLAAAATAPQQNVLPPGTFLSTTGEVLPISDIGGSGYTDPNYQAGQPSSAGGEVAQINTGSTAVNATPGLTWNSNNQPSNAPPPIAIKPYAQGGEVKSSSIFDNLMEPSDSFFCTELYKRKMLNKRQVVKMAEFFLSAVFHRTNMALFYATHGEYITEVANKHGFDWSELRQQISTDVISYMEEGKKEYAYDSYTYAVRKLCLQYNETRFLWNDRHRTTHFVDIIHCFPKVLTTGTFKSALKTYIKSKLPW